MLPQLLVVAAVSQELGGFLKKNPRSGVSTLVTGMGKKKASDVVSHWLAQNSVDAIVSTGFAGGIHPGLQVGECLVAQEVLDEATGRRFRPSLALDLPDVSIRRGRLVTARGVLLTRKSKENLGRRFEALGVDCETTAVADAAFTRNIPWISIRTILDPMEAFLFSPRTLFPGIRKASQQLGMILDLWVEQMGRR